MRHCSSIILVGFALVLAPLRSVAEASCSNHQSPESIDTRIHQLVARMTIPERIAQLQDRAPAIPRLGLPAYQWWNEGLHGLARDGYATVFPQAIGLAATWDPELLHGVGEVVSTEARAKFNGHGHDQAPRYGGLTLWSPNINIFRDPRWGRGQETYGEDPLLTSTLGSSFVKGIQGEDPFYLRADATPKHFAAHSGPEKGRDSFNAVVSAHDLADTYLRAFHSLTVEAHAAALMCSYNAINGAPSCANEDTLKRSLRESWGFGGYVVSDCDAVGDIAEYHHFAKDAARGAALALNAGTDLDCGSTYEALQQSYSQGLVTESTINQAVYRLLMARVHLGMLDPLGCTPWDHIGGSDIGSEPHRDLARRAAEESLVLLHNSGVLPLRAGTKIAVVGPTADLLRVLEANYHGTAIKPVTPLDGLSTAFPGLLYAQGSLLAEGVPAPIPRSAFRTTARDGASAGLVAEYFNVPNFTGRPTTEVHVPMVDLDLDRVGPVPSITSKQYAARWSGFLQPPASGDYTLRVNMERCWDCTTHDSFRLFVDGRLAIDNHSGKGEPERTTLHFSDTAPHAIRLELLHTGQDEGIALEWLPPAEALLNEAMKAAKDADTIVAFLGLSPDLEGEALQLELPGFAGGDRTSLDLPLAQQDLLREMSSLGKPVVVVLTSGSAVTLGAEVKSPDALVQAWYPGEDGGDAIANVLSGKVNPSGRLPVTFYRSVADLPPFSDYGMAHRTYRYFDRPVLYPFGYGLSYSDFTYSHAMLSANTVQAGMPLTAKVTIHNRSAVAGAEVTELYLVPPQASGVPRLMLAGFQRSDLQPNESRELTFSLSPSQMSTVDEAGKRMVRDGTYRVFLGSVQPDLIKDEGIPFHVTGSTAVPF